MAVILKPLTKWKIGLLHALGYALSLCGFGIAIPALFSKWMDQGFQRLFGNNANKSTGRIFFELLSRWAAMCLPVMLFLDKVVQPWLNKISASWLKKDQTGKAEKKLCDCKLLEAFQKENKGPWMGLAIAVPAAVIPVGLLFYFDQRLQNKQSVWPKIENALHFYGFHSKSDFMQWGARATPLPKKP